MTKTQSVRHTLSPMFRGALFYLFFFGSMAIFGPFINVYYIELGLTGRQVGILIAISPLVTLLFATPLSALADRRRWRGRILQVALAGIALTIFLLRFPRTFLTLVPLCVLMAIFSSPILSIADSLIARMANRRGLNYGSMRLWGSMGFASSALIFGALWQRFGFAPMFVVGSLALVPVIWVAGLQEEGPIAQQRARPPISDLTRDLGLVMILVATFFVGISTSLAISFEGIYMRYLGGGQLLIGAFISASAFSEILTMRYGTRIAERLRGPRALLLSYGLMGIAFLGYVLVRTPWMLLLLAGVKGLGFGLFFTNTVHTINLRAPVEWASTAQSLMTVGMFGLAPLIAGPLGGVIYDTLGPSVIFIVGSVALGLAALVLAFAALKGMMATVKCEA
ncbi:MAG: MFS transporter [Chloroflexi bacterium]|nr:MFS transporter [Chloroflexota bacterium]